MDKIFCHAFLTEKYGENFDLTGISCRDTAIIIQPLLGSQKVIGYDYHKLYLIYHGFVFIVLPILILPLFQLATIVI